MDLKEWIKKARAKQKLSQTDFGAQLGVVKQAVSHWEKGRNECSVTQFLKIARLAKMNPAALDDWPDDFRVLLQAADDETTEGGAMNGWPLSPELLAAMQNATPEMRRMVENATRAMLGLELSSKPISKTMGGVA